MHPHFFSVKNDKGIGFSTGRGDLLITLSKLLMQG